MYCHWMSFKQAAKIVSKEERMVCTEEEIIKDMKDGGGFNKKGIWIPGCYAGIYTDGECSCRKYTEHKLSKEEELNAEIRLLKQEIAVLKSKIQELKSN